MIRMPAPARKLGMMTLIALALGLIAGWFLAQFQNGWQIGQYEIDELAGTGSSFAPVRTSRDNTGTSPRPPAGSTIKVTRVIDGDTIEIEGGIRVRYIGMDAPESVDPRKPVQCFSAQAARKNKELVEGKDVQLEKDISETDRFGRLLRYVWIGDSMINRVLVTDGYASASTYAPNIKYQELMRVAEYEARAARRGLWSACPVEEERPPVFLQPAAIIQPRVVPIQ